MSLKKNFSGAKTHALALDIYIRNLTISVLFLVVLFSFAATLSITSIKAIKTKNFLTLKPWASYLLFCFVLGAFIVPVFAGVSFNINLNNTIWYTKIIAVASWMAYSTVLILTWFNTRIFKTAYTIKNLDKLISKNVNNFQTFNNRQNVNGRQNINGNFVTKEQEERNVQVNTWKAINEEKYTEAKTIEEQNQKPMKTDFTTFQLSDLKSIAKKIGINNYDSLSKDELVTILKDIQN